MTKDGKIEFRTENNQSFWLLIKKIKRDYYE